MPKVSFSKVVRVLWYYNTWAGSPHVCNLHNPLLEGFPQGFVHRSEWTVEELAERFHPRFTGPYASRS
jgi:hypothetical protein